MDADLLIRRLNLTTNHVVSEASATAQEHAPQQLDLFTDYEALEMQRQEEQAQLDKERRMQEAQLKIKQRFGKNAILRGLNFEEGATAKERNKQIGGHRAGDAPNEKGEVKNDKELRRHHQPTPSRIETSSTDVDVESCGSVRSILCIDWL